MKAQCLVMELSPKLGMRVRILAQGTDPPGIHGSLLLVDLRFQGFAECFGPIQTFSTQIIDVISHSFGGGTVDHNAPSSAVIFRCWE